MRKTITLPAVRAGYRVLDLCLENDRFEIETLLDSMEAADNDYLPLTIDGIATAGGFDRKKIIFGYLDDDQRQAYREWTQTFDENNSQYGDYIIKTFEDDDMSVVDVAKIESLIDEYKPDVVLVDPLYLTTYPKSAEKTPGAGAQAMSRALRRLATRKQVVMAVVVQAQVEKDDADPAGDDDVELKVPDLTRVKSTKAVLEDGTVTLGVNSSGNKAIIGVMLSRKGGAGAEQVVQFLPQYGIIRPFDEAIAKQLEAANATKLF